MSAMLASASKGVTNRVVRFMEKAALMAMQSPMKFKHGAVLVKFGRTIGSGFNYDRVRFRGKDITSVHAEINALDGKTLSTASGMSMLASDGLCFILLHSIRIILTTKEGCETH